MGVSILVLDHGYVEFIEAWGKGRELHKRTSTGDDHLYYDDLEVGIIEAARQSTQGAFRGWESDKKLLKYLYDHKHATPFEFAGMVIEVQAPIFVFREWHRHRTQSYNEMSARYAPLPDLYYVPTVKRCLMGSELNKQAQGTGAKLTKDVAEEWITFLSEYEGYYHDSEYAYKRALEKGIPKELARLVIPVGHYTKMRASANLRNWLAFMTLRLAPEAQWEIRQYAEAVATIIRGTFPQTGALFDDGPA